MKPSEHFKNSIQAYLEERAAKDELFVETFAKANKNIDDCITFIFNAVQKTGCNGFEDSEIYSMAVHYYDEDDIDIGNPVNCKVVVNHTVQLTEEEKKLAREEAIQQVHRETYARMTQSKSKTKQTETVTQQSLF